MPYVICPDCKNIWFKEPKYTDYLPTTQVCEVELEVKEDSLMKQAKEGKMPKRHCKQCRPTLRISFYVYETVLLTPDYVSPNIEWKS